LAVHGRKRRDTRNRERDADTDADDRVFATRR
jgi:hypothetical protein